MDWQEVIKKYEEANFMQSPDYQKMNEILGDKTVVKDFTDETGNFGRALMIVRDARRGRYLEIPCGPLIDWHNPQLVKKAMDEITEVAKAEKCVFVRIRPQLMMNEENLALVEKLGFKKSPMHLAAEHTVMVDLTASEEEMLTRMRRQTRYEVRKADKLEINVTHDNSEAAFKEFYDVQTKTAEIQKFVPPSLKTLMAEREAFGENATIYKASTKDGRAIAYGLIIKNGHEGDYYEAASTELHYEFPGAYAILWKVMRDLKAEGFSRFNLWGIAPEGQPNHRYAKVTTFKRGFGGEIVEFVPAHDFVIFKVKYLKNLAIETARKKRRHL